MPRTIGLIGQWILEKLYSISKESGSLVITYTPHDVHADAADASSPVVFSAKDIEWQIQFFEWQKFLKIHSVPGARPIKIQLLHSEPPIPPTNQKQPTKHAGINLPVGTKWEDITIKFIDGENVRIFARNFDCESTFKEMGFQNNKKVPRTPNKQWVLFKMLAVNRGLLTWESPQADATLKKTKQLLAEGLKRYFKINDDPFDDYRKEKGYRIKMHLIPVDGLVELPTAQASNPDDLGIDEELRQFNHG